MLDNSTLIETIKNRYSCRTYLKTSIPDEISDKLAHMLANQKEGPLGSLARFMLITANPDDPDALKNMRTYGFIKNPTAFILGSVQSAANDLEDYGFLLEEIILYATQLGIGTCWLGGTFHYGNFAKKMALAENESLPAVAAAGLTADQRSIQDLLVRRQADGNHRKTWNKLFFDGSFRMPLSEENAGPYATVLEMVRIAPSASNKQPWRILKDGVDWHFYLQRTPGYPPPAPVKIADLQRIDMGIAMCHFADAAAALGLSGLWKNARPAHSLPDSLTSYVITWHTQ